MILNCSGTRDEFREIIDNSYHLDGIYGYKLSPELVLDLGLGGTTCYITGKTLNKKILYDHQCTGVEHPRIQIRVIEILAEEAIDEVVLTCVGTPYSKVFDWIKEANDHELDIILNPNLHTWIGRTCGAEKVAQKLIEKYNSLPTFFPKKKIYLSGNNLSIFEFLLEVLDPDQNEIYLAFPIPEIYPLFKDYSTRSILDGQAFTALEPTNVQTMSCV